MDFNDVRLQYESLQGEIDAAIGEVLVPAVSAAATAMAVAAIGAKPEAFRELPLGLQLETGSRACRCMHSYRTLKSIA